MTTSLLFQLTSLSTSAVSELVISRTIYLHWLWLLLVIGLFGGSLVSTQASPVNSKSSNAYHSIEQNSSTTPVEWVSVAAGSGHTIALKSDGTLWAWGQNDYGQLGIGNTIDQSEPVQVGTTSDWISISAGYSRTVGIKSDGTLWEWGKTFAGLNDNGGVPQSSPIQVGSDAGWISTAVGGTHIMALKSDGTLWGWGFGVYGQLGFYSIGAVTSPGRVGTDTKWISVAAGAYYTLGLKSDGTLWGWGLNSFGELGIDNTDSQRSPVQVGNDNKWISITSGSNHSLGIKSDGTLWAWGRNYYGELGLGNTNQQTNPVQVGDDTDWIKITAGTYHTLGLKRDGTLWAWGFNLYGVLGLGVVSKRISPTAVSTSSTIVDLFRGSSANHSIVIGIGRQNLCATGNNLYGQLGISSGNSTQLSNFNCSLAPLPVTLRYFNGRMTPGGALLGWATAREDNNARFHIERGRDARSFESIGSMPSQAEGGNSLTELTYSFLDAQLLPGLTYYRLSQTDRDGSRSVASQIVALNRESAVPILFPNPVPASGESSLEPAMEYTSYQLTDTLGRVVQRADAPGVLNRVSLLGLPAGVYLLRVETEGGTQTFRLLR
jgi:hypothetical protein